MVSAANPYRDQRTQYDPGMGMDELCDALNLGLYIGVNAPSGAAPTISSAIISFLQSGSGMIARTMEEKARERRDVRDTAVTPSLSVAVQTTKIQAAIDALSSGQELHIDEMYSVTGLNITNKTDIRITGKGGLTLSGAASSAKIFDLVGTIDNLTIDGLELIGENNAAYTQQAIGNASGQTISNVWFMYNKISQINSGISFNAEGGGSYTKGWALFNTLKDMVGTAAGSGYGIHMGTCTLCTAAYNTVDNASRASLYQASGTNTGNVWAFNKVKNHRSSVATAAVFPAFDCLRSSGVLIAYNTFEDGYDGGLAIEHETSSSSNCSDIEVIGNIFRNRKNAVSNIYVGEGAVPGTYETTHVRLFGNRIITDESVAGAGSAEVTILNGRFVQFNDNNLRKSNVAATAVFVIWGTNASITNDADFTDCEAHRNILIAEGSDVTDTWGFSFPSDVSTNTSVHYFDNRSTTGIALLYRHAGATPTNPNLMCISKHRACVVGTGATVGAGTTAGKMRTNAAVRISYSGLNATFASTDNVWDLTAVTTGVADYCKVLLILQDAAAAAIIKGPVAASQAAATLPGLPDQRWAALGVVELGPSYAGGALGAATFYDITGIYEP